MDKLIKQADTAREDAKRTLQAKTEALTARARLEGAALGAQSAEEEFWQAQDNARKKADARKAAADNTAIGDASSTSHQTASEIAEDPRSELPPLDLKFHAEQAETTAKETLEGVAQVVEASLDESESRLEEVIEVLEVIVDDERLAGNAADTEFEAIEVELEVSLGEPYEQQSQTLQQKAWALGLARDDHSFILRTSRQEMARSKESLESLKRLRESLPRRVKEQSEEVAVTFLDAAMEGHIKRRAELSKLTNKPGTSDQMLWRRVAHWFVNVLAVIGVVALLALAVWLVRNEFEKKTVPVVAGKQVAAAVKQAEASGLRVVVVGAAPASKRQRVCAQSPLPGVRSRTMTIYAGESCAVAQGGSGRGNAR